MTSTPKTKTPVAASIAAGLFFLFAVWLVVSIVISTPGGLQPTRSPSKPKLGTPECQAAMTAYAHTLPNRPPRDDAELQRAYAEMDALCDES